MMMQPRANWLTQVELRNRNRAEPVEIWKARKFVHGHSDEELSLTKVAKFVNISPNYLSEKFKEVTGVNFVGTPSDYFDFRTNSRLYTKEGSKLDTFAYTLTSDTVMYFGAVGTDLFDQYPYDGHLQSLNTNRVTISVTPVHFNPGGYYSRLIVLQR